jgi:branched-chain amino acid transport system ATP-binding protein
MEVCDKILVLDRGEAIAFATPQQITNDQKVMDAYLGEEYQCLN